MQSRTRALTKDKPRKAPRPAIHAAIGRDALGRYVWRFLSKGKPVAVSHAAFPRRSDAKKAIAVFLKATGVQCLVFDDTEGDALDQRNRNLRDRLR